MKSFIKILQSDTWGFVFYAHSCWADKRAISPRQQILKNYCLGGKKSFLIVKVDKNCRKPLSRTLQL